MPRHVKDYEKHIACLESLWDDEIEENPLSILPVLELIARLYEVRFIRLTCNTEGEFAYNLDLISKEKRYDILYFAFHGEPGTLYLHDETELTLDVLADLMKRRFAGWIVHFGSCGTMDIEEEALATFAERTGVAMLVGYTEAVDWGESAALDLLFFTAIQSYVDLNAFWNYFSARYSDIIDATGFCIYVA
ncbi:MAG: hypothetical protein HC914_14740 [Chloroflexaceae bacterium]|nr:hypothetical protein [Chloroflexaceae bacterium]